MNFERQIDQPRLDSDLIGTQIGSAVEKLMWSYGDWKDELHKLHEDAVNFAGHFYLRDFGESNKFRAVRIVSLGNEYIVGYPDGKERQGIILDWSKQVGWARRKRNELITQPTDFPEAGLTLFANRYLEFTERLIRRFEPELR